MRKAVLCLSAAIAAFVVVDIGYSLHGDFAHAGISQPSEAGTIVNRTGKGDRMLSAHAPSAPNNPAAERVSPAPQPASSSRPQWLDGCEPAASPLSPSGASLIGARCVS